MIAKNTKTMIVKEFVRERSDKERSSYLAADTTLLCTGMIYSKQRNKNLKILGERIMSSVLRSHNIGEKRTKNFINMVNIGEVAEVKKLILRLQPYKEMKRWVETL